MIKLFDKTVLKLTLLYAVIIILLCIMFSMLFYTFLISIQANEARDMAFSTGNSNSILYIIERDEKIKQEVFNRLFNINMFAIFFGVLFSYILARKTLRPVFENMHKQNLFISNASHELRTPLTVMKLENEILLENKGVGVTEYKEQIKSNLEEVEKLQNLSNMLLNLSKNKDFELDTVELSSVVLKVVDSKRKTAENKNIVIVNKSSYLEVKSNEQALVNLLSILLENAIKYSDKNSTVEIGNDKKRLYVKDEGKGISKEETGFIFERFFKGSSGQKADGFGLGLALAKEIAEKLKVKISVKNNKEKGVTFYIDL